MPRQVAEPVDDAITASVAGPPDESQWAFHDGSRATVVNFLQSCAACGREGSPTADLFLPIAAGGSQADRYIACLGSTLEGSR